MYKRAKIILFGAGCIILCLPGLLYFTYQNSIQPLSGAIQNVDPPKFSITNWSNLEFQNQTEVFLKKELPARPLFIRLHNQLQYSLFKEPRAKHIVLGKDGYLYASNYIKSYKGSNFIGEEIIQEKTRKLAALQDTLSKLGITLIPVIAPGKGYYYPEYIPDRYKPNVRSRTNYDSFSKHLKTSKVDHIDFNKWFIELKNSCPYLLYPKTGIHWSEYGEYLAGDSLYHFMENKLGRPMSKLLLDSLSLQSLPQGRDADIADGMNLIFDLEHLPLATPHISYSKDSTTYLPKVISIADSFYWGLMFHKFSINVFRENRFWYYFKEEYPRLNGKSLKIEDLDLKKEIEQQDVIILMTTETNLDRFAFGFIEQAYQLYFDNN